MEARPRIRALALAAALAGGAWSATCISPDDKASGETDDDTIEARSLLGKALRRPELTPERRATLEENLATARADLEAYPDSEQRLIWVGRRLAYLSRYREAIAWYTKALEKHPDSFRLLRHRGHRYISVRELDLAVEDLARAAQLIEGVPDEIEPDGAPNALGIPRSTNHSNIWYHLGLAHYLQGDFAAALAAYEPCLRFSRVNGDMLVATAHWNYMTLRRLGLDARAQALLETIDPEPDVIENHAYAELIRLYRGSTTPEAVLGSEERGVDQASRSYGVANSYLDNGQRERALELMREIVETCPWAAFGTIAAEAELARNGSPRGDE